LIQIAEGNPDVSKVGAFGVGAYTMFSVCEQPVVVSGDSALAFVWKGDALWCTTSAVSEVSEWTSFYLPSRDPYALPKLGDLGEFLCSALTFTQALKTIRVYVNETLQLELHKEVVQPPRPVALPKSSSSFSSLWSSASGNTTPQGLFAINPKKDESPIEESIHSLTVTVHEPSLRSTAFTKVRFVSATATTHINKQIKHKLQRVTLKPPPPKLTIQLFLNAAAAEERTKSLASSLVDSFSPRIGRIFIGFATSQTTGLAAHVAAPFLPTVERQAMDLTTPAVKLFNEELLVLSGMVLRWTLEHGMASIHERYAANEPKRLEWEEEHKNDKPKKAAPKPVEDEEPAEKKETSKLMGFAKFMARGMQKKIVSVVNTVVDAADNSLLYPADPRPLLDEEQDAVALLQSYTPIPSTPDGIVGTCIAQGFDLSSASPPVLTRTGVVPANRAFLPSAGLEQFIKTNVVRSTIYEACPEYHDVICSVSSLALVHLVDQIQEPFEIERMILLIQWLVKYRRVYPDQVARLAPRIKDAIAFYDSEKKVNYLRDLLFYIPEDSLLDDKHLPLPETVLPKSLQQDIGQVCMSDAMLQAWFSALPLEVWAQFISHHDAMTKARPEDEMLRSKTLCVLCKEFHSRHGDRMVFGGLCRSLLGDKPCIPFDSEIPTANAAERPGDLYLYSAELQAFTGIGTFHKAAASLAAAGVTEEFLLALGVRKSVSIDFLFTNLESLKWNADPKPLVEYLRTATLNVEDVRKLSGTQYLPAALDKSRLFAPSELYLPNQSLQLFDFCNQLHWPSEKDLSDRSDSGRFLVKIGMKTLPPIASVLEYMTSTELSSVKRRKCLDFLADRLGPHGEYQREYNRVIKGRTAYRFIPSTTDDPLGLKESVESLRSPLDCYADRSCNVMGFPVFNKSLEKDADTLGRLFQCPSEPDSVDLLSQLISLVSNAKRLLQRSKDRSQSNTQVVVAFSNVFLYLSRRTADITQAQFGKLRQEEFIPCLVNGMIVWYKSDQVFFSSTNRSDSITEELFHVVDHNSFLAAAGVKAEATTADIFSLILQSPESVLKAVGSEAKYRALLRRIASNPPFTRVTPQIRDCPFLLAYRPKANSEEKKNDNDDFPYRLASAPNIYIIDNSFLGRMFAVDHAPHESDLEDFYVSLGSRFISKSVQRRFEVVGRPTTNTSNTITLRERLEERSSLLISPNITSRPLVKNAELLLSPKKLLFYEATSLLAVYSLDGKTRRNQTTCCSRSKGNSNEIFVVPNFDWFDVGYAIGDLILSRCQLEDAFFISSLLEAPLEQLRARGFPVDRMVQLEIKKREEAAAKLKAQQEAEAAQREAERLEKMKEIEEERKASAQRQQELELQNQRAGNSLKSTKAPTKSTQGAEKGSGGVADILEQMFPDADPDFLKSALGPSPTLDSVRSLAEQMTSGGYPKRSDCEKGEGNKIKDTETDDSTIASTASNLSTDKGSQKKKNGLRGRLGRALGRKGKADSRKPLPAPAAPAPLPPPTPAPLPPMNPSIMNSMLDGMSSLGINGSGNGAAAGGGAFGPPKGNTPAINTPSSPASDAQSQAGLERLLQQTVEQSNTVTGDTAKSANDINVGTPEGLDRGDTCKAQHDLVPCGTVTTRLGASMKVFASTHPGSAETIEELRTTALVDFANILERLANLYQIPLRSVSIFHDATGGTIAFNANRALHFNIRFYIALHYKRPIRACYSYWYMTMAHELAHHLVSAHNKDHGFYTESYAIQYFPALVELLSTLQ